MQARAEVSGEVRGHVPVRAVGTPCLGAVLQRDANQKVRSWRHGEHAHHTANSSSVSFWLKRKSAWPAIEPLQVVQYCTLAVVSPESHQSMSNLPSPRGFSVFLYAAPLVWTPQELPLPGEGRGFLRKPQRCESFGPWGHLDLEFEVSIHDCSSAQVKSYIASHIHSATPPLRHL